MEIKTEIKKLGHDYIGQVSRYTISRHTFKDRELLSFREWYEKDGTFLPGKKGISIPMDSFKDLLDALKTV